MLLTVIASLFLAKLSSGNITVDEQTHIRLDQVRHPFAPFSTTVFPKYTLNPIVRTIPPSQNDSVVEGSTKPTRAPSNAIIVMNSSDMTSTSSTIPPPITTTLTINPATPTAHTRTLSKRARYSDLSLTIIISSGLSHVDAYIFPCHSSGCPSAAQQAIDAVNAVKNGGTKIGMMWIDVEIYNWPSNQSNNRQFILDMANKLVALGYKVGIYSNNNNWQSIVGTDWNGVSKYPLWWANYNGHADLNNFKAFGGWTKPTIHQASLDLYTGDVKGPCSVGNFDQNYEA